MPKAHLTQRLANTFPLWSQTRSNEFGVGFQFLNSVGLTFDDLYKQIHRIHTSNYLSLAPVSEVGRYYKFQLPVSFEFTRDPDETEFIYTPPVASGIESGQWYTIALAEDNDMESFWHNAVPSRVAIAETVPFPGQVVASGYASWSPFIPIEQEISVPCRLYVTCSGGTSYLGIDNSILRRGLVQLNGETPEDLTVDEELLFIHDDTRQTVHDYATVSGVSVYGMEEPENTLVMVECSQFNAVDYKSAYYIDKAVTGEDIQTFWGLSAGTLPGQTLLDFRTYQQTDPALLLDGFIEKGTILSIELRDTTGASISALDMTVEPFSDRIWVIDSTKLYCFDATLPYPDLGGTTGLSSGTMSQIEVDFSYLTRGESVTVSYIWRRPVIGLVKHRVWVTDPSDTTSSIEGGAFVAYHTDNTSWIIGEPLQRKLRATDTFVLNQSGLYTFYLEVSYTDETSEIHKQVVCVVSRDALVEYDINALGVPNNTGVDTDSNGNLWILGIDGNKRRISFSYDLMLVDYDRKIVYFRDPYTQVRVGD